MFGCFLGGTIGDDYGRIKGIALGAAIGIVGAALQCTAQNVPWMCVARIVNGLGTGVLNAVVPVWVRNPPWYSRSLIEAYSKHTGYRGL